MVSRVLIVDDNGVALAVLMEGLRLRIRNVVIHSALSMGQALSKGSSENYDVVVVNTRMVKIDGVDLIAALHRLCPEAAVLTIALSAYCPQTQFDLKASEIDELEDLVRLALRRVEHFIPVTQREVHSPS